MCKLFRCRACIETQVKQHLTRVDIGILPRETETDCGRKIGCFSFSSLHSIYYSTLDCERHNKQVKEKRN